jgi:hypothetical protein
MLKDKEYSINPYTEDDLKENIQNVGSWISPAELFDWLIDWFIMHSVNPYKVK